MPEAPDICMILYGDVTHDSRVKREAATLAQQGWIVLILSIVFDFMPHLALEQEIDGYKVKRILAQDKPKHQKFISIISQASLYLRKINARVYHAHDFSGLVPLAFAGLWNRNFVYDSHELFFEQKNAFLPKNIKLLGQKSRNIWQNGL